MPLLMRLRLRELRPVCLERLRLRLYVLRSNRSTEPTRTTRRKKLKTHRQDKSKTRAAHR